MELPWLGFELQLQYSSVPEAEEIILQTAADVSTWHSPSPSTLALSSSAPAAAGGRLCSADFLQLCCLRTSELPSVAPGSGRAGQQWAFPCLYPSGSYGQGAGESGQREPCQCLSSGALIQKQARFCQVLKTPPSLSQHR